MREPEHLVEDEHGALQRRQRLQDDQDRHGQRLGPLGAAGDRVGFAREQGFGQPRPDVGLLAAADVRALATLTAVWRGGVRTTP
ncbi:hypothetical protein [Streptomyces erythrochromogenes]|uniref:hypothetical protein n=1 Tax=Streptomyces erythrochromogenes TaxID=285574 RepID=UPI0038161867|nr:hypothetical protein OG489_38480 [Streptomyces erythrochromogenes]